MVQGMRSTITGGPEGLEIVIPARRHLMALLFLGVWLIAWLMGEMTVITQLFSRRLGSPEGFLLLWLIFWTLGGGFAAYIWLWMLAGKERILMGSSALHVTRDMLGLGRTRTYEFYKMRNLRVAPQPAAPRDTGVAVSLAGLAGGLIAFEYEGRAIRFGAGIDEAEGQMILAQMRQRFSFAKTPSAT